MQHTMGKANKARQRPSRLRSLLRGRRGRIGIGITFVVVLVVSTYWWYVASAPYRTANRLIAAIENRDADAIYQLSTPRERDQTGLTSASIKRSLNDVFERPVRLNGFYEDIGTVWKSDGRGKLYLPVMPLWADSQTGKPVPGNNSLRPPRVIANVSVMQTGEGWRVNVGYLLLSLYISKWGTADYARSYTEMARETGLRAYIDSKGGLREISRMPTPDSNNLH